MYIDGTGTSWDDGSSQVTTDNGTSFANTLGQLLSGGAKLADSVSHIIAANKTPKLIPQNNLQGAHLQATATPAASSFKLDNTSMMLLAAVGIVVLVVVLKK